MMLLLLAPRYTFSALLFTGDILIQFTFQQSENINILKPHTGLQQLYGSALTSIYLITLASNICIYHQTWVVRSNQKPNITGERKGKLRWKSERGGLGGSERRFRLICQEKLG